MKGKREPQRQSPIAADRVAGGGLEELEPLTAPQPGDLRRRRVLGAPLTPPLRVRVRVLAIDAPVADGDRAAERQSLDRAATPRPRPPPTRDRSGARRAPSRARHRWPRATSTSRPDASPDSTSRLALEVAVTRVSREPPEHPEPVEDRLLDVLVRDQRAVALEPALALHVEGPGGHEGDPVAEAAVEIEHPPHERAQERRVVLGVGDDEARVVVDAVDGARPPGSHSSTTTGHGRRALREAATASRPARMSRSIFALDGCWRSTGRCQL